jgi:transposase-like protein
MSLFYGKDTLMKRKYRRPEQIVKLLRQAKAQLAQGRSVDEMCRQLGISDSTYYYWCKQYGNMDVDQAKRLKELETENGRLKKLVAEHALDNDILKEALSGNY